MGVPSPVESHAWEVLHAREDAAHKASCLLPVGMDMQAGETALTTLTLPSQLR